LKANAIPPNLTGRLKGFKLSEVMTRKPESKDFLGKVGFEKRNPAERLGFFVDRKIETHAFKFLLGLRH
jgi:hypothetical protein